MNRDWFKKENQKLIYILFVLAAAIVATVAINNYYLSSSVLTKGSFINVVVFAAVAILFYSAIKKLSKRVLKFGFTSGGIFSITLIFGRSIFADNTLRSIFGSFASFAMSIICIAGLTILFGSLFSFALHWFAKQDERHSIRTNEKEVWKFFKPSWKTFAKLTLIVFACYLPCYIAYFPGTAAYDAFKQTLEAVGLSPITQFNSVPHTLYLRLCWNIGGINNWIIVYSLSQMLMMAATFAYTTMFLAKSKVQNWIILTAFLFFAICPVNAIFSFSTTKDVTEALVFLIFTIQIIKLCQNPKKFFSSLVNIVAIVFFAVAACLLRNNLIYVIILFAPIIIILFRRNCFKNMIEIFLLIIILIFAITGPVYSAFGIGKGQSQEALSVPIQQIANAAKNNSENLTQQERALLEKYYVTTAVFNNYNPRIADPIKNNFLTYEFDNDKTDFLKLWVKLGLKYPGDYVNSFLSLNLPFWYIDTPYPDKYSKRDYIETSSVFIYAGAEEKANNPVYNFYESIAKYTLVNKIPVLSILLSMNLPIWMLFFSAVILIFKRKSRLIIIFTPAILLWLTYMAGPVSNMRYIYPIFVLYPILLALVFSTEFMETLEGSEKELEPECEQEAISNP
jgi:hypothetical protein